MIICKRKIRIYLPVDERLLIKDKQRLSKKNIKFIRFNIQENKIYTCLKSLFLKT